MFHMFIPYLMEGVLTSKRIIMSTWSNFLIKASIENPTHGHTCYTHAYELNNLNESHMLPAQIFGKCVSRIQL